MKSPTRLYLIRHGEVEEQYHRVFGGRIDMELSPFGHKQAEALADYLQRVPFHAIYASPMRRVQQTLREFVSRQNMRPVLLEGLREVDFGVWTGLTWDQVYEQYQVSAFSWLDQLEEGLIAQAEPVPAYRQRIQDAMNLILTECPEQTVAVVCHGGVIRMALALLLDLPFRKMAGFDIEYASVSIIDYLPRRTEVQLLNFTPWRDNV